jgi:hypothetical protein
MNGAAKVADMLGDADNGIPSRVLVVDRCARLIETIPLMEHDPNRPEDVLKVNADDEGLGGDDAYDALRYGLMWAGVPATQVGRNPLADYRG